MKKSPKKGSHWAARKSGPYDLRHSFRVGDSILILDIPSDLKDPKYKDDPEMRTAELFRFCVGRKFRVRGFNRYGYIELRVDDDPAVKRGFGLNSIWLEPQHLEMISRARSKARPRNGFGWKTDFLKDEREYHERESK